jgi:hypothetical protein
MASKDYCDNVSQELSGWKTKVFDVVSKLDKLSTGEKERVVPEVFALHMILEELSERIDGLQRACDLNWKPETHYGMDSWNRPDVIGIARTIPQSDIGG